MARLAGFHSHPQATPPLPPTTVSQLLPRTVPLRQWPPTYTPKFLCHSQHLLCNFLHGLSPVRRPIALSYISRSVTGAVGLRAPKNYVVITASATANSDQSTPSHEEEGEGAVGCIQDEAKEPPKKPSPVIEPGDVVQAQLRALRDQDFETVFEFASPKNKTHTGPLSRFTDMIQGRAYNVMLGHKSADVLSTLLVGPERFQQRVLITGSNGKQAIFSWSLSRQETDPFQDCWMTDYVHRDE